LYAVNGTLYAVDAPLRASGFPPHAVSVSLYAVKGRLHAVNLPWYAINGPLYVVNGPSHGENGPWYPISGPLYAVNIPLREVFPSSRDTGPSYLHRPLSFAPKELRHVAQGWRFLPALGNRRSP
jgi:hypothetical protein